jgi:class 3 adenylate cyclase/tetratricopeptide (TPR) repeat protein
MIVCSDCGERIPESRFCPNCGKALRASGSPSGSLADRRVVTVLFAEVVGLQGGGTADPEEVKTRVDACMKAISAPVFRYGGTIDKYIGDSVVMALFGAPVAHEDDPERAVRAAREMQREAALFGAGQGLEIRLKVGVNTGLVVAGAVGGREKRDYTVMGDTVNLAQRLEDSAAAGEIRVGQETAERARGTFAFRQLPPLHLKGKEAPVAAYVLSDAPAPEAAPAQRPPLIGRDLELGRIASQVRAAHSGNPQACILRGEAGMGKAAVAEAIDLTGFRIWRGHCRSFDERSPFALVRDVLRHAPTRSAERFAGSEEAELLAWVEYGGDAPPRGAALAGIRVDQLQSRAADLLAELVLREHPVAIVLEDLQWLDDASRMWLDRLIERFRTPEGDNLPVFLCLTTRPGGNLPDLEGTHFDLSSLNLPPLRGDDAVLLAAQLLDLPADRRAWPLGVADAVDPALKLAEGNARFILELVGNLLHSGALRRDAAGKLQADAAAATFELPSSIQAAIRARLDRLGSPARSALQVAAVQGRLVSPDVVRDVAGQDAAEAGVPELVANGVLVARGADFVFRQDLVREAAYEALLHRTRRTLHRSVASAILKRIGGVEARAPDATDADRRVRDSAALLAWHLVAAEDWRDAARFLWLAAQRARLSASRATAVMWLENCLKAIKNAPGAPGAPEESEVWLALGRIHTSTGEHEKAAKALDKALETAGDTHGHAAAHHALAESAEQRSDYDTAVKLLAKALDLPPGAGVTRAQALCSLATIRFRMGEFDACMWLLKDALREARGDPALAGLALSLKGLCHYRKGNLTEALTAHRKSLEQRQAAGDLAGVTRSLNNIAVVKMELGDTAGSLADCQEALSVARRIGDRWNISMVLTNLGHWEIAAGMADRAVEHLKLAIELKIRLQDPAGADIARVTLGEALVKQGKTDEGIAQMRHAIEDLEVRGIGEVLVEAYLALGKACLGAGRQKEAKKAITHARDKAKQTRSAARLDEAESLLEQLSPIG